MKYGHANPFTVPRPASRFSKPGFGRLLESSQPLLSPGGKSASVVFRLLPLSPDRALEELLDTAPCGGSDEVEPAQVTAPVKTKNRVELLHDYSSLFNGYLAKWLFAGTISIAWTVNIVRAV